jgi:hypothetical protein
LDPERRFLTAKAGGEAMVRIEMSPEKAEMLREALVSYLSELRLEITRTHLEEFREFMRRRGEVLEACLQRLEGELTSAGRDLIPANRLGNVDILQGLTDWELRSVSQFFQAENFAAGFTLCREGERAERLFILEEGAVAIRMQGGEAVTIDTPGKTVGCSFLVPPNRFTAIAVTLTPAKMLTIQSPDFSYLIHKTPRLGIKVMANLAQVVAGRLAQFKGRP